MLALALTFMNGPRDGEVLVVDIAGERADVTIGRTPENSVAILDDPELGRRHARLTLRGDDWWLEDLNSTNGTFVGEFDRATRLVAATRLTIGDIFRVGCTRLRVEARDRGEVLRVRASDGRAS